MTLTNEQIEQILDGAPGADEAYQHEIDDYIADCIEMECVGSGELLREILNLRQEVGRLKVEVESKNHDIIEAVKKARTQWARDDVAEIKKRESEVAALAVEEAVRKYRIKLLDGPDIYSDALIEYANQLKLGES